MARQIHPTAIIEPTVELDDDVVIGPYAFVGEQAVVGAGTVLHHHATVQGNTRLGGQNEVFPFATVGMKTHDLKYKGGAPGLIVGDRNVFREYTSVHMATNDGEFTRVGSDNVILAYSHIAHDCVVGNHLVMSSQAALAGHVVVEDHVNIGWGAGVHQFCRVGEYAMIGAMAKIVQDVPPFVIADGSPAVVRSINKVGLDRSDFGPAQLDAIKQIFRIVYRQGLNRGQALDALLAHPLADTREFKHFLAFAGTSQRGFLPGR
jgi:UDP-N-acetylglucosamine acyltransferase